MRLRKPDICSPWNYSSAINFYNIICFIDQIKSIHYGHAIANGVYHYHGTSTYPYVVGAMRGKVTLDPATPAPENQILPQAFAKAARPATSPLKGAVITAFAAEGLNGYFLTYTIGSKSGSVRYSWDASNKFTFTLTDTAGVSKTTTYQR